MTAVLTVAVFFLGATPPTSKTSIQETPTFAVCEKAREISVDAIHSHLAGSAYRIEATCKAK